MLLLSQEHSDLDGKYVQLRDARCEPKPVQRPHPPIAIGGNGPTRTLRTVARFAQQWNSIVGHRTLARDQGDARRSAARRSVAIRRRSTARSTCATTPRPDRARSPTARPRSSKPAPTSGSCTSRSRTRPPCSNRSPRPYERSESDDRTVIEKWHAHLRGRAAGWARRAPRRRRRVLLADRLHAPGGQGDHDACTCRPRGRRCPVRRRRAAPGDGDAVGRFRYTKTVMAGDTAVLEFETTVEGKYVNGVDIIRCNDEGRIVEIRVMIRPLQAINLVHQQMKAALERMQSERRASRRRSRRGSRRRGLDLGTRVRDRRRNRAGPPPLAPHPRDLVLGGDVRDEQRDERTQRHDHARERHRRLRAVRSRSSTRASEIC